MPVKTPQELGKQIMGWSGACFVLLLVVQCVNGSITSLAQRYQERQPKQFYLEDGTWIESEKSKPTKERVPSTTTVTFFHDGKGADIVTNCQVPMRKEDEIFVEPGESIQIRHVSFHDRELENRCSLNAAGDARPIYGAGRDQNGTPKTADGMNVEVRSQFQYDLPFPYLVWNGKQVAAVGAEMVFVLCEPEQCTLQEMKVHTFDYIKSKGGITYLHNTFGKRLKFNIVYNYMVHFQLDPRAPEEIGRDGSTATFSVAKYDPTKENPGNITVVRPPDQN